jgi:hypothetical protein
MVIGGGRNSAAGAAAVNLTRAAYVYINQRVEGL